jgi:hypothetical protein
MEKLVSTVHFFIKVPDGRYDSPESMNIVHLAIEPYGAKFVLSPNNHLPLRQDDGTYEILLPAREETVLDREVVEDFLKGYKYIELVRRTVDYR